MGKPEYLLSPREILLDTNLASRDVVNPEIFIVVERIGASAPFDNEQASSTRRIDV
jgi:hypothetical protein